MAMPRQMINLFATGGYIGRCPVAPGTLGTLWGLPMAYCLARIPLAAALLTTVLLAIAAVWAAGRCAADMGRKDPGAVVIDEVVGMVVTLLGLPFTMVTACWGFVVFRLFDIVKPWPVGWLDRRLSGGLGIVADDVAAGILANLVLRAVLVWMG